MDTTTAATTTTTIATTTTLATTTTATIATTAPAATTSQATTTTVPPRTTTRRTVTTQVATASPTVRRSLGRDCPVAAVALLLPGSAPLLVGPVATTTTTQAGSTRLAYPADGSVVNARDVSLADPSCARATAQVGWLSLFGGAVEASRISLVRGRASVAGLSVGGRRPAAVGAHIPLAQWGYVVVAPPSPIHVAGRAAIGALAVHLTQAHAGLPAGTIILVTAAGSRPRALATHEPLKVTPPLADKHYVFPVVGPAEYGDTYGAFRSDVAGDWHHGDDIFVPLGTPVVAVASGTINRVGWNPVGGWRVWVRDGSGDEFYYAHLSGYAPHDLHTNRVRAGEVIGFVGNTGDAFTTVPHLHFEIHPRQLLRLGYDGAVDPTTYLNHWQHLAHVHVPVPVHPALPRAPAIRKEAAFVFRELLVARHLVDRARRPSGHRPAVLPSYLLDPMPIAAPEAAAAAVTAPRGSSVGVAVLAGIGALLLAAVTALAVPVGRRRLAARRQPPE